MQLMLSLISGKIDVFGFVGTLTWTIQDPEQFVSFCSLEIILLSSYKHDSLNGTILQGESLIRNNVRSRILESQN